MMNTVSTEAGRQAMKALRSLELTRNNVSTEAGRKEATIRSRRKSEMQIRMVTSTQKGLWELWHKTNSQIGRNCILDGIVSTSREITKLEKELE